MSHLTDQRDGSRRLDEGCPMTEDEKLRFILIVSAMVAALAVHRFLETSQALAHSTGVRFFAPSGSFAVGSGILMFRVLGLVGSVAVCSLQTRRADGFDRHRIVVAAAGV